MGTVTATINDVYKNTEDLKIQVSVISQKITSEETTLKDLQEQVKKLDSPPMIG